MKVGKLLFIWVFFMIAAIVSSATILFAAEPPGAVIQEKIIGPTMWAAVVMDCSSDWATTRIKKIEGCVVDTQAVSISLTACNQDEILYTRFDAGTIFEFSCEAIITKIKNFKRDPDPTTGMLWSFDAQIQFIVPDDEAHKDITECP